MKISDDCAVSMQFVLKDNDGSILSESTEGAPLTYLHGHGQIITGLERSLEGKSPGDAFSVTLPPEEAYGLQDSRNRVSFPRNDFIDEELIVGNHVHIMGSQGPRHARIIEFDALQVVLDTNHELAGKTLCFDIRVEAVRKATFYELSCGHVHGMETESA